MMKRFLSILLALVLAYPNGLFAEPLPALPPGPLVLTSVKPEQLTPEYWIHRLPDPHRLIKTPEEIKQFNQDILAIIRDQKDIFAMDSSLSGKTIADLLAYEFDILRKRIFFGVDDQHIQKSLFDDVIRPTMQWETIPNRLVLKWGVATQATSVRALPTNVKMLEELRDVEFDQLQYTLIKLWTPVAIYHTSADGKWFFIQAPYIRGWVKAKDIAPLPSRAEIKKYVKASRFLTVTGESVPVYEDPAFQNLMQRPSMGTVIPWTEKTGSGYSVLVPVRQSGGGVSVRNAYIKSASDVNEGFLPYTQANVIRQAFKLLGARYGWGGTYHGRDCSGFTQDVFLPFGIDMPRASHHQGFIGTQLSHFEPFETPDEKEVFLRQATPAITLLRMQMHMMIYLGEVDGNFYIIHSTWAERIGSDRMADEKRRINQVVVSDLTLNGNSYLGPLFQRIISMNELV